MLLNTTKQGSTIIRKRLVVIFLLCVGWLLTIGFVGKPTAAEQDTTAMDQIINAKLNPPKQQTALEAWNGQLAKLQTAEAKEAADAKAEQDRLAQQAAEAAQQAAQVAQEQSYTAVGGTCQDWMNQAGITDQGTAYQVIMIESGCNPNAVNHGSGACGIGQQLPCGKWPHAWNDPVGGLIDMQNYVMAVYGSWANALYHEHNFGWY